MLSIDTLELTTSTDYIKGLDRSKFTVSIVYKPNGMEFKNYSLTYKPPGINKISINETQNRVTINASSKILGSNYSQGITFNTLEQFIYEINNTGVELDQDFVYDAELKKVDVKDDLKLTKDATTYLDTLNQLTAPKFTKTKYPTGITFNENIKQKPSRLTGYGKEYEMQTNKDFYKKYPSLYNDLDNVLRIESRLNSAGTIKKHICTNSMLEVLDFSNLNYNILNKIVANQTNFKPIIDMSEMSMADAKNYALTKILYDQYNGDYTSIINYIKGKLSKGTNPSYQVGITKKYIAMINNNNENYCADDIEEIKTALAVLN